MSDPRLLLAVPLTMFLAGCSPRSSLDRVVVSGRVSYQGKPIEVGAIRFIPEADSQAPAAGAIIANGKYVADGHGGVPVGIHRIWIEAFDVSTAPNKERGPTLGAAAATGRQYLPAKYNSNSQLILAIEKQSDSLRRDFDLDD